MAELHGLQLDDRIAAELPDWEAIVAHLRTRRPVAEVLRQAAAGGRPLVQPRCGVGGHREMVELLRALEPAGPGVLSVTIDSHTRLRHFDTAAELLARNPADLNGYPLVAHGWQRGRELAAAVDVPLEVRHGSPDGRELFAVALAAGLTSYEGGGIGYNLPYSKNVPLGHSLRAWQQVDAVCGVLAAEGVLIDRELFGTLTAVLVPPSVSLAVTVLEAVAAAREGVRCLSIAYPQGGEIHQDVAALRAVRTLAARYLDPGIEVHPVLHEFMGVFPRTRSYADLLILHGGLLARLGGATKVISKTHQEAYGIPDAEANADGIRTAALGACELLDFVRIDEDRVSEEQHWIEREVAELVDPVLNEPALLPAIEAAFAAGRLDIPFSASVHAHSRVVPRRDACGAIRYAGVGALPFSAAVLRRHADLLAPAPGARERSPFEAATADIRYFLDNEDRFHSSTPHRTRSEPPQRF
ncbi:methylaspartate mutase [Streptomyces tateyamensis]|uniref:Methylaspartate mutase n=1 Tax=Streptomyces tateyamensis TaxID=565073 RepID=A0A2V4PHD8_9ACTN|nr:methylaspartate mutase [Streptomyces tateyamensis]PYC83178.1 methylaspartate mutase [Streptomyces tateyamensis]